MSKEIHAIQMELLARQWQSIVDERDQEIKVLRLEWHDFRDALMELRGKHRALEGEKARLKAEKEKLLNACGDYLSGYGACDDSPDDGSSSLCADNSCLYCVLARVAQAMKDNPDPKYQVDEWGQMVGPNGDRLTTLDAVEKLNKLTDVKGGNGS